MNYINIYHKNYFDKYKIVFTLFLLTIILYYYIKLILHINFFRRKIFAYRIIFSSISIFSKILSPFFDLFLYEKLLQVKYFLIIDTYYDFEKKDKKFLISSRVASWARLRANICWFIPRGCRYTSVSKH